MLLDEHIIFVLQLGGHLFLQFGLPPSGLIASVLSLHHPVLYYLGLSLLVADDLSILEDYGVHNHQVMKELY